MFQVIIPRLQDSRKWLERQVRILSFAAEDLDNTISGIARLSGMEDVVLQLRKKLGDMREEENILRQMLRALNQATLDYMNHEGRIISELEAGTDR